MDGTRNSRRIPVSTVMLSLLSAGALVLSGCGWDIGPEGPLGDPVDGGGGGGGVGGGSSTVEIDITGSPVVTYSPGTGKTSAVVQFIARDAAGLPLDADEVTVTMFVDGQPLDNESILREDSAELSSSIHLGLVLDASFSMLQHSPPAFGPMLTAARDAVAQGLELYAGRPGTFTWDVSWFNETIAAPAPGGRSWVPSDLLTIPAPGEGTATKLFAAVQREAGVMRARHATTANGPRDHHVMIVLSDGADNYSWFDNRTASSSGITSSGAPYDVTGWRPAALDSAVTAIGAHPNLIVHVLGMGSAVSDQQLSALAKAGDGRYVKNPDSGQIGSLFDAVTREFATIQDHGAIMPLPPGDYAFELRVRTLDGRGTDTYGFQFHAGDEQAGLRP